jgi:hypothetical protein
MSRVDFSGENARKYNKASCQIRYEGFLSGFVCPEGARFSQPWATPREIGSIESCCRPNGPTVHRTPGPLRRSTGETPSVPSHDTPSAIDSPRPSCLRACHPIPSDQIIFSCREKKWIGPKGFRGMAQSRRTRAAPGDGDAAFCDLDTAASACTSQHDARENTVFSRRFRSSALTIAAPQRLLQ